MGEARLKSLACTEAGCKYYNRPPLTGIERGILGDFYGDFRVVTCFFAGFLFFRVVFGVQRGLESLIKGVALTSSSMSP